jgi:hypothetical protein
MTEQELAAAEEMVRQERAAEEQWRAGGYYAPPLDWIKWSIPTVSALIAEVRRCWAENEQLRKEIARLKSGQG